VHGTAAQAEGGRCRWKPELGADGSRRWELIGPVQRKTKEMVWAGKKVLGPKLSKE
jgi:hypothetical protein